MAYMLNPRLKTRGEVRLAAAELVDAALQQAEEQYPTNPTGAVHQIRKLCRRLRALLRLLRPALPSEVWKGENALVRDLARQLSTARDAAVSVLTFERLCQTCSLPPAVVATARAALEEQKEAGAVPEQQEIAALTARLTALRGRVDTWAFTRSGWPMLREGLQETYQRGQAGLAKARRTGQDDDLHDCRKRAKELWHQLDLLSLANPKVLGKEAKQAHLLADLLGEDQDLTVLRHAVEDLSGMEPLLSAIDQGRNKVRKEALRLGRTIYNEKPAAFADRIEGYWKQASR